jgi:hypothetical protein
LIEGVEDSLPLCVLQIDIVERVLRPGIPVPKGGPTEKQKVPVRDWIVPAKIEKKNIDYTLEAAITLGKTRGRRKSLATEDVSIVHQDEERVVEDDQMIEVYTYMYMFIYLDVCNSCFLRW